MSPGTLKVIYPELFPLSAIDDIRIFNRALTAPEIQSLYHENGWTGE